MEKPTAWNFRDIEGHTFGRLKVLAYAGRVGRKTYWECLCECGTTKVVRATALRPGRTQSCGCLCKEIITIHGRTNTPEWTCWRAMKARCDGRNEAEFPDYAGRGIKVCERWGDFLNFLEDMGDRPSPKHTIDRIDGNGDYCLENCRWATWKEQQNNRRSNRLIEHEGRTLTLAQWADEAGMCRQRLHQRLKKGWSFAEALNKPVRHWNRAEHLPRVLS